MAISAPSFYLFVPPVDAPTCTNTSHNTNELWDAEMSSSFPNNHNVHKVNVLIITLAGTIITEWPIFVLFFYFFICLFVIQNWGHMTVAFIGHGHTIHATHVVTELTGQTKSRWPLGQTPDGMSWRTGVNGACIWQNHLHGLSNV